jgi:alpha-tubulin suppressor-like RCC1 family protein
MRNRKTAAPAKRREKALPAQESGLIDQSKAAQRSATRRAALDNRSHRTAPLCQCYGTASTGPQPEEEPDDKHADRRGSRQVGVRVAVSTVPGRVSERQRLSRTEFPLFFTKQPSAEVLLEACGSAHHWRRELQRLGHRVSLLHPRDVAPYRTGNKTDRADAKALLEASRNEQISRVPVKSLEQQALIALHRIRQGYPPASASLHRPWTVYSPSRTLGGPMEIPSMPCVPICGRPADAAVVLSRVSGILAIISGSLLGCSDGSAPSEPDDQGPVMTVSLSLRADTVVPGESRQVVVTVRQGGLVVSNPSVSWRTTNPSVATVSASGVTTAVAPGTAFVVASVSGASDSLALRVARPYRALAAFASGTCGLREDELFCWGGFSGQPPASHALPTATAGVSGPRAVAVGSAVRCALAADSTAWCWGLNLWGSVGDGTRISRQVPTPAGGGLRFAALSAGGRQVCGILGTGSAVCWGGNEHGQLGNGTTADTSLPVAVVGIERSLVAVDAGQDHTCAIDDAGALYCWGGNGLREVGLDSASDIHTPLAVDLGAAVVAVSAGLNFTCALTISASAHCWGGNIYGQLGRGAVGGGPFAPSPVVGGHSFVSIAAGSNHACAVATSGLVLCWGQGEFGQLGDGGLANRGSPAPIASAIAFSSVHAGVHSCARTALGAVFCWGSSGNLGIGATEFNPVPRPVRVADP